VDEKGVSAGLVVARVASCMGLVAGAFYYLLFGVSAIANERLTMARHRTADGLLQAA
jgi:hypothetical protein